MHKHELINQWVTLRSKPFELVDAAAACGCAESTAGNAVRHWFGGHIKWCWKHVGSGRYRKLFFPLGWSEDQCLEYMHSKAKSGKSKAKIEILD